MAFESYGKDGKPRTLEETFWDCIDDAQKEWDFQIRLKPEDLEMEEPMKSAYLSERLLIHLSNILPLAKMMKEQKK